MIPEWMLLMDMTPEEREEYQARKALAARIERIQNLPKDHRQKKNFRS